MRSQVTLLCAAAFTTALLGWHDAMACTTGTCFVASGGTASSTFTIFSGNNDAVDATSPGSGYGVYGKSSSSNGVFGQCTGSVAGVRGESTGGGYGVKGDLVTTNGVAAVFGDATTFGIGVYGTSSAAANPGVKGVNSNTGVGVYGSSTASTGTGVFGVSAYTAETNAYAGVYGSNTSGGWAGYFDNDVYVGGRFCNPTCVSDVRLKKNVTPVVGSLEKLLQIHGVTYEWKETNPVVGRLPGTHMGVLAQDVEKAVPAWVGQDSEGNKALNIDAKAALGLTVEALRELNDRLQKSDARNDAQDKIIKAQAEHGKEQDDRIDRLEHGRAPRLALNPETLFVGFGFFAVAGVLLVNGRKKREDEKRS
jgi:hypothetical protein